MQFAVDKLPNKFSKDWRTAQDPKAHDRPILSFTRLHPESFLDIACNLAITHSPHHCPQTLIDCTKLRIKMHRCQYGKCNKRTERIHVHVPKRAHHCSADFP
eukprot:9373646-Karenia_brevis.AAC.1